MNQRQCCALLVVGLLAAATCPAQPFPSFILDTNVVIGPSMDHATGTSVAFGPDTGLVVWVEASMLCGVRLDGNGRVLDTLPMDIDGPELEAYDNMQPDVAWGSGRFLVVWTDWDQAMCALVTPGGRVTQRRVLQDSLRPAQNERVSVAFDGDNFLAAWTAYSDELGSVAYFARVSPEGTVLDSPPRRVVPDTSYDQGTVAVGFHGDRYLALWTGFQLDLRGSFVLPDGSITDSSGFLIRTGSTYSSPAVTHDGYHFVACWNERPYMTKVARITDDGIVLDTSGVCIDSSSLWANDVFSTGETTLVVFCSDPVWGWDSLAVMAVRADTALRRLDSVPVVLSRRENGHGQSAAPGDPSVAVCGRDFLVAWCQPYRAESVASNNNAVFRRVSGQGQPVESVAVTVSYAANHHAYPDLASDGDNHLAVWVDYRRTLTTDSQRLHAMRFSPAGARLDPEPIDLGGYRALRPAVAFGGGCYLVAWHDAGDVYAVRVGSDGRLLDSVAARLNGRESARSYLDVSYCDSMFLVAWETRWTRTDQVRGVRVNPEGRVL
ncbi:hypothetical protein FJY69_09915, partial [candidate division WOR-3 bacterium]|nr:hypothetical protein [candidate division WOR-3 bacterium]